MTEHRRVLALAALALLLAAATAQSGGAAARGPVSPVGSERFGRAGQIAGHPTRVLAIGDSVLKGAASTLPAALPGREVVVDAEVSRSTGRSADAAATHGTGWDVVVVLLGHNDGGSPGAYQPAYRRLLDMFAGVPRIVVMTIHEVRPYYPAVNAFLRDEATRRPNVRILDWNAVANANPGSVARDGLHLTPSGAQLMAATIAMYVNQAEQDLSPKPTTTTAPTTTTTTPTSTTARSSGTTSTTAAMAMRVMPTSVDDVEGPHPTPSSSMTRRPHTPIEALVLAPLGAVVLTLVLLRERRLRQVSAAKTRSDTDPS
ncbi:MAG: hypothetical protein KDB02_12520 [Acidimicrobiales bacterium]|nr:hypothetical protein [Acidimicrobiales bacterium]